MLDLLYGEWLRDEVAVALPRREEAPDLTVLLAAARDTAVPLTGRALADARKRNELH